MARRPDSTATLATVSCPTLVIVGEQDSLTPPAESEKMANALKGAKLIKVPNSGHVSNVENPQAFNAALTEFCDGLRT